MEASELSRHCNGSGKEWSYYRNTYVTMDYVILGAEQCRTDIGYLVEKGFGGVCPQCQGQ